MASMFNIIIRASIDRTLHIAKNILELAGFTGSAFNKELQELRRNEYLIFFAPWHNWEKDLRGWWDSRSGAWHKGLNLDDNESLIVEIYRHDGIWRSIMSKHKFSMEFFNRKYRETDPECQN